MFQLILTNIYDLINVRHRFLMSLRFIVRDWSLDWSQSSVPLIPKILKLILAQEPHYTGGVRGGAVTRQWGLWNIYITHRIFPSCNARHWRKEWGNNQPLHCWVVLTRKIYHLVSVYAKFIQVLHLKPWSALCFVTPDFSSEDVHIIFYLRRICS